MRSGCRSDSKSTASYRGGLIRLPALIDSGLVGRHDVHLSTVRGPPAPTNHVSRDFAPKLHHLDLSIQDVIGDTIKYAYLLQ
jgi:hypothetical protein